MKLTFLTSAADPSGWPIDAVPEVALAGRSNAGKSSFLNALSPQKVAKVSQMPGKTRLLNFFKAGDHYRMVDMPGYGYSARSGSEQMGWGPLIEQFIRDREQLRGVLLFVDSRREWSPDEQQVIDFSQASGRRVLVCLTKVDQLNRREKQDRELYYQKALKGLPYYFISAEKDPQSIQMVEDFLFKKWIKI
jgi:GTP-binding protein